METVRDEVITKYFDLVQEEIKRLAKEDGIPEDKIQQLNDDIVDMGSIDNKLKPFIDQAALNDLDIKKIAKDLYDEIGPKVKNNTFNQNDPQGVPNKLKGERKIQNFGEFLNELYKEPEPVKLKWSTKDFRSLYDQLVNKTREAAKITKTEPRSLGELVEDLEELGATELAEEIISLTTALQQFSAEKEAELSKLN